MDKDVFFGMSTLRRIRGNDDEPTLSPSANIFSDGWQEKHQLDQSNKFLFGLFALGEMIPILICGFLF